MITITIIGSGNVAYHLAKAISISDELELVQLAMRDIEKAPTFIEKAKIETDFGKLKEVDLYLVAVADNAIEGVIEKIATPTRLIAHTSGTSELLLSAARYRKGVFYPLQTFSKTKDISFAEVPICIETFDKEDLKILKKCAEAISNNVYEISSQQRKVLHVAAVFVNNFVNHLYVQGEKICDENGINFEILKPLIKETAAKIEILHAKDAQTGPAKRGDTTTINQHLNFLKDENQKEIYKIITQSIINNDKKL